MKLVYKDGVQVMDLDPSADDNLIHVLKALGWKYISDKRQKEDSKMKYSIGDRVIVKESGEKGIVVEILNDGRYRVWIFNHSAYGWSYFYDYGLLTDLTAIEKPFGLLSKEVQDELKALNNGENIQLFMPNGGGWETALFKVKFNDDSTAYRLDPNWKEEEVKEMTVADVEKLVGGKVKIVK